MEKQLKLLVLCSLAFLAACNRGTNFDVDVSKITVDVKVERFDVDFTNIDPAKVYSCVPELQKKYGDFFNFYVDNIISIGTPETAKFQSNYADFINWARLNTIISSVENVFPKEVNLEPLFEEGFKHYKYYFPKDSLPKIITIIAGYHESVFPTDNLLAFSLEKYLGTQYYNLYESFGIQRYNWVRMSKESLPVDYFRALINLRYPKTEDIEDNLLNEMIYRGRNQFFLKSMMPSLPDSLLWGYTDVQYRWVEYYESNIWTYLVDRKLLFDRTPLAIRNLTGEGPYTNAFGNQSAPGAASYCGYRIVCNYMKNHPDVTLQQLMTTKNFNEIYSKARYNP